MSVAPVPLSQIVLKVHSRCDLACDHCYVYEGADLSWHNRPMTLTNEVMGRTAGRIAEHAQAHQLDTIQVILHGGEPLMAGVAGLRRIIKELQSALRDVCRLDLRIHTNGVLLNERFCELFAEHGVKVGISLDGDQAANDRHRRYADGRSSYRHVLRALELLRTARFRDLYAGLLCTIDIANDPLAVYQALVDLDPPRIDFLLPHATWDTPPARPGGTPEDDAGSAYADWLIAIFDRWMRDGRPVQVRTFESIISTLTGGDSLTEALGLGPSSLVVIETDGTYEQADSLKVAFDGAPVTGFDVFRHGLDDVGQHPGIVARQQGRGGLCETCQQCPVVTSCGGGLYAHRYAAGTEFANPSVYCADLFKLITHISRQLPPDVNPVAGRHAVRSDHFQALASGLGNAAAIGQLAEAQRSLRRGLLGAVYETASSAAIPAGVLADLRSGWTLLAAIDQEHPQIVADVLAHPYVRVWAVQCLKDLRPSRTEVPAGGTAPPSDLRHLGAIAAVAAIRAGARASVTVPVTARAVCLPSLGTLAVPPVAPDTATLQLTGDAVTVQAGDCWTLPRSDLLAGKPCFAPATGGGEPADWQPVRVLQAPGIRVTLEDTDPYRNCHQWPAATRLTDAEFARWQLRFADAWQLIRDEHGSYAAALAAGLATVTPLAQTPDGADLSDAARDAFGAVAAALPADPVTLALLLIREFQHVKLGAILDLYDLDDRTDGLLQGTYAQLAVTDFWRARQAATTGQAAETAGQRFAHGRAGTRDAIETLTGSGSLTPLGMRFVAEMRHSVPF
jgi:uncharacterized protein